LYATVVKPFSASGLKRFRVVRILDHFVMSRAKPEFVHIDGHALFLDPLDSLRLSLQPYEPNETEVIKRYVRTGDTVVDVGANIGYHTLLFAKLVGPDGKVFAFEPEPATFTLLTKNSAVNAYQNVQLINKAGMDTTRVTRLYLATSNLADHRIYDSGEQRQWIEISAVKLDDYFEAYESHIDFIKMDIQGAEGLALQGMRYLLRTHRRVKILTEFWPAGLRKCGTDAVWYLRSLAELGFRLCRIRDSAPLTEPVVDIQALTQDLISRDAYTNLLCIRDDDL